MAAPPYSCTRVRTLLVLGVTSTAFRSDLDVWVEDGSYRQRVIRPASWDRDSSHRSVGGVLGSDGGRRRREDIPTDPEVMALEVMGLVHVPYGASVGGVGVVVVVDILRWEDFDRWREDGGVVVGVAKAKVLAAKR